MKYINLLSKPITILNLESEHIVRSKKRVDAAYLFKGEDCDLPILANFEAAPKSALPKFTVAVENIANPEGFHLLDSKIMVDWPLSEEFEEDVTYIVPKHVMDRLVIAGFEISNLRYLSGSIKNSEGEMLGFASLIRYV